MIEQIVLYVISFSIFVVLQSLIINGIKECFTGACTQDIDKGKVCKGQIFYRLNPEFFERNKDKWWAAPVFACIKCMAHWSLFIYWPIVIFVFGFHWIEIPIYIYNLFILVYLNFYFYKKL